MKTFFTLIFLNTFLVFSQGLVDGFFKGKGKLDMAFSAMYQTSDKYFAGTKKINYERDLLSISAFGEYGITEKWDVILNIPVINFKLQDGAVFTKYHLVDVKLFGNQFSVIPAVGLTTPLSNYNTESGQAIGQRATQIMPRLVLQQKLPAGMFIQVQGGYNYALNPVVSSVPFSAKLGMSFGDDYQYYFDVWYDYQQGIGDIDYLGNKPYNSFREFVVSYNRIGGVFFYQINKKIGAFINGSYIINGRNIGQAIGLGTGLVYKFNIN